MGHYFWKDAHGKMSVYCLVTQKIDDNREIYYKEVVLTAGQRFCINFKKNKRFNTIMKAVELYYVNGKRVDKSTYGMIKEPFISCWTEHWQIAGRTIYITKIDILI